jgi:hypothetical protein
VIYCGADFGLLKYIFIFCTTEGKSELSPKYMYIAIDLEMKRRMTQVRRWAKFMKRCCSHKRTCERNGKDEAGENNKGMRRYNK